MRDPADVVRAARAVPRPGGRLVIEMGGHMNVAGVRAALHRRVRDPRAAPSLSDSEPDPAACARYDHRTPSYTRKPHSDAISRLPGRRMHTAS